VSPSPTRYPGGIEPTMPTAKILTTINLGPLQLFHRAVVMAPPSFTGGPGAPKVARHAARGGLVLQPVEAPLGLAGSAPSRSPSPGWDWRALNNVVRAKGGFTVAQLSCSTTAATVDQSEARLAACRDMAVQALAMQFDGAELEAPGAPQPAALLDMVQVLIDVWGADRVGVQIAPFAWMSAPDDQRAVRPFSALLADLSDMEIAYVHLAGAIVPGRGDLLASPLGRHLRAAYPGILVASGGFTPTTAIAAVEGRWADMIGFPLPVGDGDDLLAAVRQYAR